MTKATKPAQRRKRPTTRKKKSPWYEPLLMPLALILALGFLYGVYWVQANYGKSPSGKGLNPLKAEALLIAGQVDMSSDRKVAEKDGIERWAISVKNKDQSAALLKGLQTLAKAEGLSPEADEIERDGKTYNILTVPQQGGNSLRIILIQEKHYTLPKPKKKEEKPTPKQVAATPEKKPTMKAKPVEKMAVQNTKQPAIAIILDDVGQRPVSHLNPVLDLKYPMTFAVLPFLPHTKSNAIYLNEHNYEIMLHMPMEPSGSTANPGKGAIYTTTSDQDIRIALDNALNDVPFVKGVNNHMGSRFTASRKGMRPVIDELRQRNLYFIDSRTNAKSVGYTVALEMGIPAAKRDVFLDSEMSYEFAKKQLAEVRKVADRKGIAILIGHPYPSSLKALQEELPEMDREGYRFIYASDVIEALNGLH